MKRIILLICLGLLVMAPSPIQRKNKQSKPGDDFTPMANPASMYCLEMGHELEIRETELGQQGFCIFPDGNECDEWDFYNGLCSYNPGPFRRIR